MQTVIVMHAIVYQSAGSKVKNISRYHQHLNSGKTIIIIIKNVQHFIKIRHIYAHRVSILLPTILNIFIMQINC